MQEKYLTGYDFLYPPVKASDRGDGLELVGQTVLINTHVERVVCLPFFLGDSLPF